MSHLVMPRFKQHNTHITITPMKASGLYVGDHPMTSVSKKEVRQLDLITHFSSLLFYMKFH